MKKYVEIERKLAVLSSNRPFESLFEKKKLSQKMHSILSGVEQSTISKIENLKESPQEKIGS